MSGIRVTYSGLISLLVGLVSILVGLLFTLVVTRTLDPRDYGTWGLIGGLVAYATILEPLISIWATRETARNEGSEKTAILSSLLLSGGGVIIFIVSAFFIGSKLDIDRTALFFGAILVPAIYLNRIFTAINLGWRPHIASYGQLSFVITEVVLGIVLVHFFHLQIYGVIVTVTVAYLVSVIILGVYSQDRIKNKIRKEFIKKWLKLSWLQAYQTIGTIIPSFDVTIFSIITGSVIGLAFWTASTVITNFVKNSSSLILVANSRIMQEGGNTGYLRETLTQFFYFSILFASLTITFAKQGLFMLNPLYQLAVPVVIIMSIQAFLSNLTMSILTLMTGVEKVDVDQKSTFKHYFKSKLTFVSTFLLAQSIVYVTMLLVGLLLFSTPASSRSDLLIYWAVIALVSQIPFTIYSVILLRRNLGVMPDGSSIVKYLLSSCLAFGLAYFLMNKFLIYKNNVFEFFPNLALFIGFGVGVYLLITYFIDKRTKLLLDAIIREFKGKKAVPEEKPHPTQPESGLFENKLDILSRKPVLSLVIIGVIGLLVRLYYFPYNVPLIYDGLTDYFAYASDIVVLGHLPTNFFLPNNGWPIFLSFFFSIFRFDSNPFDYMTLQRLVTISISVLTIIPVYFLCLRFSNKSYAILAAALFAFEPRIIQNSLLGITDPLYILLVASALALFFSSNKKKVYTSFGVVALASLVRAEGLFVFFPLIIVFFITNRKESKIVGKTLLSISIYILVLLPLAIFRIVTQGSDQLTGRIVDTANIYLTHGTSSHGVGLSSYFATSASNIIKLAGWSLIPLFIIFVPIGLYIIFRNRNPVNIIIIALIISMILPVLYGFSVAPDPRYMYPLFPIFCILAIFTVRKLGYHIKNQSLFLILIIGGILLTSGAFLDIKKYDYEHQREAFSIAHQVTAIAKGVNDYYQEDGYIRAAELSAKWPTLSSSIPHKTVIIPASSFDSLEKYVEFGKTKGLTHLVLDGSPSRPSFLNDVFYHEVKYPFLTKVYDSSDHGYKYHVKIFQIDYNKFEATTATNK